MTEEMRERNRATMLQKNCLFETIETLPRNVGYMKLNGFTDASACHDTTARAMASLNDADALIVDLRDNGGGFGETALHIAGYLFDRPTYMHDPVPTLQCPPEPHRQLRATSLPTGPCTC
jgi:C-terminal processing protease CtpA/Prc